VINTRDIEGGILKPLDQLDDVKLPATFQIDHYRVWDGDVLVSARGAFKVARVRAEHAGALAGPNLIVVRPSLSLKSSLLYAFLQHPDIQSQIQRKSVKTTVASIGIDTVANLYIKLPDASRQVDLALLVDLAERQYVLGRRIGEIRRELGQDIVARELIV
jgi:restriction endonuclease S subunit